MHLLDVVGEPGPVAADVIGDLAGAQTAATRVATVLQMTCEVTW